MYRRRRPSTAKESRRARTFDSALSSGFQRRQLLGVVAASQFCNRSRVRRPPTGYKLNEFIEVFLVARRRYSHNHPCECTARASDPKMESFLGSDPMLHL